MLKKNPLAALGDALFNAGLPQIGITTDGVIQYSRPLTPAEETTAAAIIAAYVPPTENNEEMDVTARIKELEKKVKDLEKVK